MSEPTIGLTDLTELHGLLQAAAAEDETEDIQAVLAGLAAAVRWARGANYVDVEACNLHAHRPARAGGGGCHLVLRRGQKRARVDVSIYDARTQIRSEVERLLRRLDIPRSNEQRDWPSGRQCIVVPLAVAQVLLSRTRPRRCAYWVLAQTPTHYVFEVLPVAQALEDVAEIPPPQGEQVTQTQWDMYWRYRTAGNVSPHDRFPVAEAVLLRYLFDQTRPEIDARTARVLCVGSGISILPHALAAAGFPVTVLDWSRVALDFGRAHPPTSDELQAIFALACEEFGFASFEEFRREDGSAVWVHGDVFDPTVCSGPYDIIITTRFFERLSEFDVRVAITRLDDRLRPDGWCWVAVQNSGFRWIEVQREFDAQGYAVVPYSRIPARGKAMAGGLTSG